jgi:hypothetical protein
VPIRFLLLVAAGLMLAACGRGQIPGRVRIPASSMAAASGNATSEPRILSAHLAHVRAAELGGKDGILVVFSEEVDPASLVPRMLLVVSTAGHRMPPERALLSPARRGQTRTVLLIGDFTREEREPSDVVIVGPLYSAGGVSMKGRSHPVDPPDAPRRVVSAERLPGDGTRCEGAPQVVRLYWNDRLRADDAVDLDAIRVWLRDGTELAPVGVDPAFASEPSARGNNVLDLCLIADSAAHRLRMDAGALHDAAGEPSLAVEVPVTNPPGTGR